MSYKRQAVMMDSISEVLEIMFFTIVNYDDRRMFPKRGDYKLGIQLHRESRQMEISFRMTGSFARTMTANLLGMEEEDVMEEEIRDTLREFTNMVGGNYQIKTIQEKFLLGLPYVEPINEEEPTMDGELSFSSGGELLGTACLRLDTVVEHVPAPHQTIDMGLAR